MADDHDTAVIWEYVIRIANARMVSLLNKKDAPSTDTSLSSSSGGSPSPSPSSIGSDLTDGGVDQPGTPKSSRSPRLTHGSGILNKDTKRRSSPNLESEAILQLLEETTTKKDQLRVQLSERVVSLEVKTFSFLFFSSKTMHRF